MSCLRAYQDAPEGDRSKLLNYFIDKRLNNLTESIGEFWYEFVSQWNLR